MIRFTPPCRPRVRLRVRRAGPYRIAAKTAVLASLSLGLLLAVGCGGSIDSRLAEIRALQDAGEFSSSIEPLREILGRQPDHAEANYLLGVALVQTRQPSVAIWPLQKATQARELAVPAGILLASTLMNTGSFDEAVRAATRVLEVDPERAAALQVRAHAQMTVGNARDALEDADRLLELQPDAYPGLVLRASALTRLDRHEEAEATYLDLLQVLEATGEPAVAARGCVALASFYAEIGSEKVVETMERCTRQFPTDATVLDAAARYYDATGRMEVVDDLLRVAVEEEAHAYGPRHSLAQRLLQQGKREEAEAVLVEGAELFDSPDAWARLAQFYQQFRESERALEATERALALLPAPSEELAFRKADLLVDLERYDEAEALAAGFSQQPYRDLIRGRIALAHGDESTALQTFEAGLLRWPDNAAARFLAGVAAEGLGDTSKALAHYREAVRASDTATDAALSAARLELARGHFADAASFAGIHLERRRPQAEAYQVAIRALTAMGRFEEARARADQFLAATGDRVAVGVERAALERRARGPAAGLQVIEESGLDLTHPDNLPTLRSALEDLVALGRMEAALSRLDAAVAAHEDVADFHELRARLLLGFERVAEARASIDRAEELAPESPTVANAMAHVALAEGRADAAVELLDRAVAARPEDTDGAYLAAQIRLSQGDAADAERRLRDIVQRHPAHAPASNDLAWLLSEREGERAFALELAERAARIDPRPEILDTLGWVQLQRGDAEAAVETFERALEAQPEAASVRYRYALALEAEGRAEEALEAVRRALEAGGFPEAEAARAQVARLEAGQGAAR